MDWKNNKTIQFAVGCTLLILVVRWLLTGDLLLLAATFAEPLPADAPEGATKSTAILQVAWPIVFEATAWIGASAIAWAVGLWGRLFDLVASNGKPAAKAATIDGAAQELVRAVALNDMTEFERLSKIIRGPYAKLEAVTAMESGDFETARKRVAELESIAKEAGKEAAK